MARSDTDVQIVRYIPLSLLPQIAEKTTIFTKYSEWLEELAVNVLSGPVPKL